MKTWTRQADGTYKVAGEVTTRQVKLEIIRPGRKPWLTLYQRSYIEKVIADAIATGHARADAYRLHPVETTPDPETQARLRELRTKHAKTRWREPAATRAEAARLGNPPREGREMKHLYETTELGSWQGATHWTEAYRRPYEFGGEYFFRCAIREWERHLQDALRSGIRGIVAPDGFERDLTRAERTRLANHSIRTCEERIRFWLTQLHDHRREAVEFPTQERRAA